MRRPENRLHPLSTPLPRCLAALCLLAALLGLPATAALGQAGAPDTTTTSRSLILEDIQLTGTARTPLSTVLKYLPLRPGQAIDQAELVDGVRELRESSLFNSVDFYTRPGTRRGHLVLVLEVEEHSLDFRWAVGNTDLDGWYLVPVMIALDNPTGRGDLLDLQWRLGFRHSGLLLNYARPRAGDGRSYWGTRLYAISTDRPYFYNGVEYRHNVGTAGIAGVFGRRLGERWLGEFGLKLEGVDASDVSEPYSTSANGDIEPEPVLSGDDLPPGVRSGIGDDARAIFHFDLQHDTRSRTLRAGTPVSGLWGRLKTQATAQGVRSHLGLQADLRAYRNMPGGVLAMRLRGSVVGEHAAFYDRLYLGGMYSVRGFPTHSLSAPGGDTWLWSGSVEHRSRILGDSKGTKLAGVFFLDAGAAGEFDRDAVGGIAAGAGYGLRLRVWWLGWIGLDVGFPLTERPVDQRFQTNLSIGWSF